MPLRRKIESKSTFNASKLTKVVSKDITTQVISETRFAAKGAYSKEFLEIVRSFPKIYWDKDQLCWTMPLDERESFIDTLKKREYIHTEGDFFDMSKTYKNTVLIEVEQVDKQDISEYIKLLNTSGIEIEMMIYLEFYTKSISGLFDELKQVDGELNFDINKNCFIFIGNVPNIRDFFHKNFFNTTFEYVEEICKSNKKQKLV